LNWNELDGEKELCCVGGVMDVLIPCSTRALGTSAFWAEISPVSGGMARMGSFKTKPFCDIR